MDGFYRIVLSSDGPPALLNILNGLQLFTSAIPELPELTGEITLSGNVS